jgi:hypothetical protein
VSSGPYTPNGVTSFSDEPPSWNHRVVPYANVRVKNAIRLEVLEASSGFIIGVNGDVYAGSTVDECVRCIVTALVAKGLEK